LLHDNDIFIIHLILRLLWQNFVFSLASKAAVFGLAIAGFATLWMAVAADVGASLIVIANGMRLLRGSEAVAPSDDS
jgi:Cd2+/Zn2+-exporting ATPase